MLCYGVGNIANDFWLEQVTKRGWTSWEVPDVTTPKATTAWGLIVVAAVVLCLIFVLPLVRSPDDQAGRSPRRRRDRAIAKTEVQRTSSDSSPSSR